TRFSRDWSSDVCSSDLESWIASGLMTVDEMQVDCCYALQDKTWARDPDGNEWEVFVVLENTEPTGAACDCGEKVSHSELATEARSEERRVGKERRGRSW